MAIFDSLQNKNTLEVVSIRPFCVYTKDSNSFSDCIDRTTNAQIVLEDVDDTYGLDIIEEDSRTNLIIPAGSRLYLKPVKGDNKSIRIVYKNIECSVCFDDYEDVESPDDYFVIAE